MLRVLAMEAFWRDLISQGAGLRTNSNLTGWLKGWAVIPSLPVMKGYNKHKNGFPKMTLSVIFLTKTFCIFPPLADVNRSLDFSKYLEGMIPSWMQLRSAPESIKESNFWKIQNMGNGRYIHKLIQNNYNAKINQ